MHHEVKRPNKILDPGYCLTLRPMTYPQLYEMYKDGIKNNWTVEEVDLSRDLPDLRTKFTPAEKHMIDRLVAFFATGDNIVSNNLVLSLYKHINAPEARMYLSRQLFEEALHIQQYLTILDTYVPDPDERFQAFAAVENIPSIRKKAEFCDKWMEQVMHMERLESDDDKRTFLLNLICFATCVEGLFFFGAFAYVYYLRSRGLLNGLAMATSLIFKDESCHMKFAFEVIDIVKQEEPHLFDAEMEKQVYEMLEEAIECETQFAEDLLQGGVIGLPSADMKTYLQYCADHRFLRLGMKPVYNVKNPFSFMELQDIQELSNFFERRVSAYSVAVPGSVSLDSDF